MPTSPSVRNKLSSGESDLPSRHSRCATARSPKAPRASVLVVRGRARRRIDIVACLESSGKRLGALTGNLKASSPYTQRIAGPPGCRATEPWNRIERNSVGPAFSSRQATSLVGVQLRAQARRASPAYPRSIRETASLHRKQNSRASCPDGRHARQVVKQRDLAEVITIPQQSDWCCAPSGCCTDTDTAPRAIR